MFKEMQPKEVKVDIENAIVGYLRERNRRGVTYTQMERELGVARSYLHGLVNGANDPGGITLRIFQKLFPTARIELEPDAAGIRSDSSDAGLTGREEALAARERELAAERRELDAIRRELDAERRLLELEREVRPPVPPPVLQHHESRAPYLVTGAKSTSYSPDKED